MARIDKDKFMEKNIPLRKQKKAIATYCCGEASKEKVVQIDMYGTTERKEPNPPYKHKTQVLQVDKEIAIELIEIFRKHFEL